MRRFSDTKAFELALAQHLYDQDKCVFWRWRMLERCAHARQRDAGRRGAGNADGTCPRRWAKIASKLPGKTHDEIQHAFQRLQVRGVRGRLHALLGLHAIAWSLRRPGTDTSRPPPPCNCRRT